MTHDVCKGCGCQAASLLSLLLLTLSCDFTSHINMRRRMYTYPSMMAVTHRDPVGSPIICGKGMSERMLYFILFYFTLFTQLWLYKQNATITHCSINNWYERTGAHSSIDELMPILCRRRWATPGAPVILRCPDFPLIPFEVAGKEGGRNASCVAGVGRGGRDLVTHTQLPQ